jgi:hypothetical protein
VARLPLTTGNDITAVWQKTWPRVIEYTAVLCTDTRQIPHGIAFHDVLTLPCVYLPHTRQRIKKRWALMHHRWDRRLPCVDIHTQQTIPVSVPIDLHLSGKT